MKEQIQREWVEILDKTDDIKLHSYSASMLGFWLSKLDEYADAKLEEVAKEVERLHEFVNGGYPGDFRTSAYIENEAEKYYANQKLEKAASLIRSAMTNKNL